MGDRIGKPRIDVIMALDFSFGDLAVGYFEEPAYPRNVGRHRYMPYRGPGHYEMARALTDGPVRCSFKDGGATVEFIASSVPEYGVVQIDQVFPGTQPADLSPVRTGP